MFDSLPHWIPPWLRGALSVSGSVSLSVIMSSFVHDKIVSGIIGGLLMTLFLLVGKLFTPTAEKYGARISDHFHREAVPMIGPKNAPRIVFVDDEVSIGLMSRVAESYRVEHYEALKPAVRAISDPGQKSPAAVILDLRLPGSSPEGALTAVRAVYEGRLILFTGMPREEVLDMAERVKAEVWEKPMYGSEILLALGTPPPVGETP